MRDFGRILFFELARKRSARRPVVGLTLLAGTLFLCGTTASAQQSFGSLSGVVQDGQGAVIPNAKVELTNTAQGVVVRELMTSAEGSFVITPLPPAIYSLAVEAQGFQKYVKTRSSSLRRIASGCRRLFWRSARPVKPSPWRPVRFSCRHQRG